MERILFIEKNEIILTNAELFLGTDEFDQFSKCIIECKQIRNNVQVLKFRTYKGKFNSFFEQFEIYLLKNQIIA